MTATNTHDTIYENYYTPLNIHIIKCPDFFVDAAGEINFRGGMRAIAVYKKESLHLEPGKRT